MDEKLFAETRLRRGAYGQRYDNGQRWDGKETQLVIEAAHSCYRKLLAAKSMVKPAEFAAVLNSWIQKQRLEELLIDVADYLHVHNGPGIMLTGHEADYSLDKRAGADLIITYHVTEAAQWLSQ